jgi:hypothetical protein
MLSALNLVWFTRIIAMIQRRFARRASAAATSEAVAEVSLKGDAPNEGQNTAAADGHAQVLSSSKSVSKSGHKVSWPEPTIGRYPSGVRQRSAPAKTGNTIGGENGLASGTAQQPVSDDRLKRLREAAAADGFGVSCLIANPTMEDLRRKGLA